MSPKPWASVVATTLVFVFGSIATAQPTNTTLKPLAPPQTSTSSVTPRDHDNNTKTAVSDTPPTSKADHTPTPDHDTITEHTPQTTPPSVTALQQPDTASSQPEPSVLPVQPNQGAKDAHQVDAMPSLNSEPETHSNEAQTNTTARNQLESNETIQTISQPNDPQPPVLSDDQTLHITSPPKTVETTPLEKAETKSLNLKIKFFEWSESIWTWIASVFDKA